MTTTRIQVSEALHGVPDDTVEAVIGALVAAGAHPDWDSETIEAVLEPLQDLIVRLGFPPVGSEGPDGEYTNFWVGVESGDVEVKGDV